MEKSGNMLREPKSSANSAETRKRCREILARIDTIIPSRYVEQLEAEYEQEGIQPPKRTRIYNVRRGIVMDLDIMRRIERYAIAMYDEADS